MINCMTFTIHYCMTENQFLNTLIDFCFFLNNYIDDYFFYFYFHVILK